MCVLPFSFSAPCFGNQKQSTSLPDDFMQLLCGTNPEPVAQIMKYKVSRALHAVTSYYTCMKLPYVLIRLPFTFVLDCNIGINFATTYR